MQHCLSIPESSNANVKHYFHICSARLPCCLPPWFPVFSPEFIQLGPQLHHPVLADSHNTVCVLPTASEWFVLCQQTCLVSSLHLQLHRRLLLHSITGLSKMSPSFEVFCEKTVYSSIIPPMHHALKPGLWDACGSRTTMQAAVSAKHPNASYAWKPVCCCCHWHRRGERGERGRWKLLGKRKWSFLVLERGSCLPEDREEGCYCWDQNMVLDMAEQLWLTSLEMARLPLFPLRLFSRPQALPSSFPPHLHLVSLFTSQSFGTQLIDFQSLYYIASHLSQVHRGICENMTRCKGRYVACTSRIWIGSYRKVVRQIAV